MPRVYRDPIWNLSSFPGYSIAYRLYVHITTGGSKITGQSHYDFHVEVPRVDYEKLADKRQVENSEAIRKRVQAARERQLQRFAGTRMTCNAEMGPNEVRTFCETDPAGEKLMKAATQQLHLSARAYHRVLKLARTIADLAGSDKIAANHIAEAIQYRPWVGI